jgi:hypothetical protein
MTLRPHISHRGIDPPERLAAMFWLGAVPKTDCLKSIFQNWAIFTTKKSEIQEKIIPKIPSTITRIIICSVGV